MKKSKLLAALMLASLCGISESEAKSHKSEIKHLERQKDEIRDELRTEGVNIRTAEMELDQIDRAIRKEKKRERTERELKSAFISGTAGE